MTYDIHKKADELREKIKKLSDYLRECEKADRELIEQEHRTEDYYVDTILEKETKVQSVLADIGNYKNSIVQIRFPHDWLKELSKRKITEVTNELEKLEKEYKEL